MKRRPSSGVEVRRVGSGLELRVEGTLASLYRPGSLTGIVWWALAAPVLLVAASRPRVLVLGLAAGSVARAIRELAPEASIVGVERDGEVLRAARQHFDLDALGVHVVEGDALAYLRAERRSFDLVVEDVFVGTSRTVRKPEWLLQEGYALIGRRLRNGGVLSANTIHEMPAVVRACRALQLPLACIDVESFWNRIVVGGRDLPSAAEIRRRLEAHPALSRVMARLSVHGVRVR